MYQNTVGHALVALFAAGQIWVLDDARRQMDWFILGLRISHLGDQTFECLCWTQLSQIAKPANIGKISNREEVLVRIPCLSGSSSSPFERPSSSRTAGSPFGSGSPRLQAIDKPVSNSCGHALVVTNSSHSSIHPGFPFVFPHVPLDLNGHYEVQYLFLPCWAWMMLCGSMQMHQVLSVSTQHIDLYLAYASSCLPPVPAAAAAAAAVRP
ncbi:hypothetical protein B0T17DRAFT_502634 [Bombardia bombarda]|uniref:Uncharacterized protein n=1 Tax=Bombardia bombarda TaxID=252184 RepID=A0AA39XJG4_9PEZI|nr:hypothetical protein B0T17DRAFT_502634 [Bombardia bombarda]